MISYFFHIVNIVCIYSLLAISLDLVAGQAGLLSLSHAAFFGLGAYTSALLGFHFGLSVLVCTLAGMLLAAMTSIGISLPSLRLHDDYFTIASFAFQLVVTSIMTNWMDVTQGPLGLSGIPPVSIFGWKLRSPEEFSVLGIMMVGAIFYITYRIAKSPFGRVLKGIREDEVFVCSVGKNPLIYKVKSVAVSAAMAALAGSLYAHYVSYIDPSMFNVSESILMISMVIIGGAGSAMGPFLGALVLVVLPELLRFMGLPATSAANLRQIIYGGWLVVMMLFRPGGLVGTYSFGRRDDPDPVL